MQQAARMPPFGITIAAGLLAGTGAGLLLPGLPPWPLLATAFAAGIGLWWRGDGARRIAGAVLLGYGLSGLHAAATLAGQLPMAWEQRDAIVSGAVVGLPVSEPRRTRFLFRVDADAAQPRPLRGRLLRLAWYDDDPSARAAIASGSRWRFPLRLRAPHGLRNPGGGDGEKQAFAQRIAGSGYLRDPALARRLAPPRGLDAWRETMSSRISGSVAQPSSRFVRALALGDTRGLGERDWELLRACGLTHLVAISGFHVGLVAGFLALVAAATWRCLPALGRWLPRAHAAAVAGLVGAAAYTAIAGFALPTVRTSLMIAVVVAASLCRRPQRASEALAMAVITMLLIDPLALLGAGFWLSFVGVAWLLWCLPHAARRPWHDFLSAQGVATIGLLPLTVALFGQASLAGPLANLVAVPWWSLVVVPLALSGTALDAVRAGWGAWAWRLSAQAFDLSWPLFEWLGSSALALLWLPEGRWFALPLALAGAFWLLLPRGVPGKSLALLLWLPLLWPQRDLPRAGEFELEVIDVGQGLSVLVRTSRHALLYDMGPAIRDGFDAGERAVVPALHGLGVRSLDAAIVSHGDNDHAGGWPAVERQFPAARVFAPAGSPTPATRRCMAGRTWQWDGVRFRMLHPTPYFPYLKNESSCVLRIAGAHGSALLTGDIGEVVEAMLLRRDADALRSDVVLVPHHGSGGSSAPAFIAATGARHALVSSGAGNRFGHPRPEVVQRWCRAGAEVIDTAESGALRVGLGAGGVVIEQRRRTHPRLWDAVRRQAGQGNHRSCDGQPACPAGGDGLETIVAGVWPRRGLCYRQDLDRPDVPED
jgi:competence protein ComEC